MKIQNTITIMGSALLIAGCAHHERQTSAYNGGMATPTYGSTGASTSGGTSYNYSQPPGNQSATQSTSEGKNPSDARTITQGTAKSDQPVSDADQGLIVIVQKAITDEPAVSAAAPNVNVNVQNGSVVLTGTVANEQQKQQIEQIVKNTTGVSSVDNQLQVAYKPTGESQSTRIYSNSTSQAEGAATSPQGTTSGESKSQDSVNSGKASSTQFDTEQKQSTQSGNSSSGDQGLTPTSDQRTGSSGENFAANVQGTTAADQSLAQKVIERLRADSTLSSVVPQMRITIEDGKATLRGSVKSEDQKQQIEKALQQVDGVNSVDDQLKVSATQNDSTNP